MNTTRLILLLILGFGSTQVKSQDLYMTRNGKISFFSKTPMENIDGTNNEVLSVLDIKKGDLAFAVLVKGFHFEKALMEEHFNENYMESTKFPKATFQGKILNLGEVAFQKDGRYPVQVEGNLTIHGVIKKTTVTGEIFVSGGKVSSKSNFKIKVKDFNIEIPGVVSDKIAEDIDVTVDCAYQPKEK